MLRSEGGSINKGRGSHGHCRWQELRVQKPCGRRESLPLQGPVGLWVCGAGELMMVDTAIGSDRAYQPDFRSLRKLRKA